MSLETYPPWSEYDQLWPNYYRSEAFWYKWWGEYLRIKHRSLTLLHESDHEGFWKNAYVHGWLRWRQWNLTLRWAVIRHFGGLPIQL